MLASIVNPENAATGAIVMSLLSVVINIYVWWRFYR